MKKHEVTRADIEHMKRVLSEIKYHKDKFSMFERERIEVERKVEEEMKVSGISYNSIGSKASTVTPYINELIMTEASLAEMKRKEIREVNRIMKTEHLKERYDALTVLQYNVIKEYFFDKASLEYIGKKHQKRSKQWASNTLENAIKKMLEVEIL